MNTFATVAALAVLTTAGVVGASVTSGGTAIAWAVGTLVVAAALALQLRRQPGYALPTAVFATAITLVSAGLPATLLLSERVGTHTSSAADRGADSSDSDDEAAVDPSTELRSALDQADRILPGGSNSLLQIDIDDNSTQIRVLDLAKGESVYSSYSRSGATWGTASRSATNDRANAAFRRADLAALDLTATREKVHRAADQAGIDRTSRSSADGVVIERRDQDQKLVVTFAVATSTEFEADPAGNLPDNLALAKVDGLLPVAERLLRDNGIDPAQPVLSGIEYKAFAPNANWVGPDRGTVEITVDGAGRYGTLKETVGRFPVVTLKPDRSAGSHLFPLGVVSSAGIERARADLERRFAIPPVDAHALGLEIGRDTTSPGWTRGDLPPLMQAGLGPDSSSRAYYRTDGAFVTAER
ncbi:hypothetical protein [Tsukamurella sp. 1534]|uniref:hypothetical protein n=1 Tax=Tsukamurella sp. 1534 TaxID=1151061 RepID=UPI0002FFB1BB|nr:hypothetical protein [Tsukamurella sp. 1534]